MVQTGLFPSDTEEPKDEGIKTGKYIKNKDDVNEI